MADKPKRDSDEEVLQRARTRFAYAMEIEQDNRDRQAAATRFVYVPGEQWKEKTRKLREGWGDPCMEFPQLKQFVNQVINDQRQNRPGIRVHPAGGDASEEVAEIHQGLIRGIEYDSRAEAIYDNAYQHSVVGGRGYWRIYAEYESEDSFNQKLRMAWIPDPLTVLLDPDYKEPDGSDRGWGFVFDVLKRDEFERKYPGKAPTDFSGDVKMWFPDGDHVIVADYYERVAIPRKLAMLSDGTIAWADEVPAGLPDGVTVVKERESRDWRVDWYTVGGGTAVLERHEWPGKMVPIVCTTGDEIVVEGKRVFSGLIEPAMDAQRLFNYGMTQQAIHLALTPRAPIIAEYRQIEGFEDIYKNANNMNLSVLPYKAVAEEGNLLPMPSRQPPATPDSGWINWTQQMSMLMRSTIGMYENSLAMRGQETSGRAILAREKQGDNATFHFADNLSRAIALTGRIILEVVPTYYDTARIVYIVKPDGEREEVEVNVAGPLDAIARNDIRVGKYAVTVEAGPSYATKRQETSDTINQIVQAYPALMQVAGDLVMRAQQVPEAEEFAERLKLTLPPQIQQMLAQRQGEKDGKPAVPPEVQAQIAQAGQAMQQMQQQLQALANENASLKAGHDAKIEQQKMADEAKVLAAGMDGAVKLLLEALKPSAPPSEGLVAEPAPPQMTVEQQMAAIAMLTEQVMALGQQMAAAVTAASAAPRQITLNMPGEPPMTAVSVPMAMQ